MATSGDQNQQDALIKNDAASQETSSKVQMKKYLTGTGELKKGKASNKVHSAQQVGNQTSTFLPPVREGISIQSRQLVGNQPRQQFPHQGSDQQQEQLDDSMKHQSQEELVVRSKDRDYESIETDGQGGEGEQKLLMMPGPPRDRTRPNSQHKNSRSTLTNDANGSPTQEDGGSGKLQLLKKSSSFDLRHCQRTGCNFKVPRGQSGGTRPTAFTKSLTDITRDMKRIQDIEQRLVEEKSQNEDGDDDLKEKLKEIKMQEHLLKANQQKINGIEPDNFDEADILCGIQEQDDLPNTADQKQDINRSWTDHVIVRKDGTIYIVQNFCYVLLCLCSSYIYVGFAAFGSPELDSDPGMYATEVFMEIFFVVSLLFNFLVELKIDGQVQPVRDLQRIAMNYIRGYFIFDLIPCLPLQLLDLGGDEKLFYIVKVMRIYIGIEFIDISAMLSYITDYNIHVRLKRIIDHYPIEASDTSKDRTYLSLVLVIGYCLKVSKLVFIIMTITYFLGMFWFIICIELHHATESHREVADPEVHNVDTYIATEGLYVEGDEGQNSDSSKTEKVVQLMYFAYTTLSTVGFGDKTPVSDYERLITCVILLLGVAIFGLILNNLVGLIDQFKAYDAEIDEGNELREFFGCLKHYNNGIDIDINKKREFERYFEYRWLSHKNSAIDDQEEKEKLEQLPEKTLNMLYKDFLYKDFLKVFSGVFSFTKNQTASTDTLRLPPGKVLYYDWDDQIYRDFMIELFQQLEPRFEPKGSVLYNELEEIQEIFFHEKGSIDCGFEINRKQHMVLRIYQGTIVGAYNCIYHKKSMFVYQCHTNIEGYMLRKQAWFDIMDNFEEIANLLKEKIKGEFLSKIKFKVCAEKRKFINKLKKRAGQRQILQIVDLDKEDILLNKIDELTVKVADQDQQTKKKLLGNKSFRRKYIMDQTIDIVEETYMKKEEDGSDDEKGESIEKQQQQLNDKINMYLNNLPRMYRHLDNCLNVKSQLKEEILKAKEELRSLKIMNNMYYQKQQQIVDKQRRSQMSMSREFHNMSSASIQKEAKINEE